MVKKLDHTKNGKNRTLLHDHVLQHDGWEKKTPLSESAKQALESKKVSPSFFCRFREVHPEIKLKIRHKVSVKRGLRCSADMAIDYLDALATLLIEVGIAPDLKQTALGIWEGNIVVSQI